MKPILFSTPMVQAILAGRKTQTRRVIKPQPPDWCEQFGFTALTPRGYVSGRGFSPGEKFIKLPCQPGDTLWMRETWRMCPDGILCRKAGGDCDTCGTTGENTLKWRPSIHMPREAARIFLKVIGVRAERVQDITYDDCLREGMWNFGTDVDTLAAFQDLWQTLYAKKGYDWDTNPWVWVIEFEREGVKNG